MEALTNPARNLFASALINDVGIAVVQNITLNPISSRRGQDFRYEQCSSHFLNPWRVADADA